MRALCEAALRGLVEGMEGSVVSMWEQGVGAGITPGAVPSVEEATVSDDALRAGAGAEGGEEGRGGEGEAAWSIRGEVLSTSEWAQRPDRAGNEEGVRGGEGGRGGARRARGNGRRERRLRATAGAAFRERSLAPGVVAHGEHDARTA